jgi:hypothetical protein
MSEDLAQWLSLREAADTAARSTRVTRAVAAALGTLDPLRIVDLATGTGANMRYLIDRVDAPHQEWLAIDRSPVLLSHLTTRMSRWRSSRGHDVTIETRELDLNTLDPVLFAGRHLVTASALLDLVSETWLRVLAAHCRTTGAAALFAITYNGRTICSPAEQEDELILTLFNQHQHRDKGLGGPAAGPDAARAVVNCFSDAGYHVESEPSDWTIEPQEAELQRELIAGWAYAAAESDPNAASTIAEWRARRLAHVDAGRSRLVVGHDDCAAWIR